MIRQYIIALYAAPGDHTRCFIMDDYGNAVHLSGDALDQWSFNLVQSIINLH